MADPVRPPARRPAARRSPAAPARNSAPVTAKFAVWIQPRGPSASDLTGWRSGW
jgi:hypothetical protein